MNTVREMSGNFDDASCYEPCMVILLMKSKTCDEVCDPTPIHVAEQDHELLRNY